AADMDVVALDGVAVLRDRHSGAEKPDVADVVLSAGIGAAREVDVHRAVELQPRLAPVRDVLGVALGVGERETAADIAGAGDETGANRGRLGRKAQRRDRRFDRADALGPRIWSPVSLPTGSTTPIQFRSDCFCGCAPTWAVRSKVDRGAIASAGARTSLRPSFSSIALRKLSMPHASITYLRRALARLVRSPWSMKTRTTASATFVASAGFTTTPVSCPNVWCPVMPPSSSWNQTPGSTPKPSFTSTA